MNNDLISREALKKEVVGMMINKADDLEEVEFEINSALASVCEKIDNAPTVTDRTEEVLSLQNTIAKLVEGIAENERPQGEWIVKGQDIYCSICNQESAYNEFGASKFSDFCPNCGAKMQRLKGGRE